MKKQSQSAKRVRDSQHRMVWSRSALADLTDTLRSCRETLESSYQHPKGQWSDTADAREAQHDAANLRATELLLADHGRCLSALHACQTWFEHDLVTFAGGPHGLRSALQHRIKLVNAAIGTSSAGGQARESDERCPAPTGSAHGKD
jgi:hypothetical protein